MKATVIGHVCIDHNLSEHIRYEGPGGPAIFIHKLYQQFSSVTVDIIAPYGKTFLPFETDLPLHPRAPGGDQTLVYENRTHAGSRTQKAFFRETAEPVVITSIMAQKIKVSDIVFIAPLLPNFSPDYIKSLVEHASTEALKILIPQGFFRSFDSQDIVIFREFSEADAILENFDVMILSEHDYPDVQEKAIEWSRQYQVIILVTLGEKGCLVVQDGVTTGVNVDVVPESEVVDSVGAGDIFSAAFAYVFVKNREVMQAVEFANSVARESLFYSSAGLKISK